MSSKLEYLQRYMSGGGEVARGLASTYVTVTNVESMCVVRSAEVEGKKKRKKSKKRREAHGTHIVDEDPAWEQVAPSREAIDSNWERDGGDGTLFLSVPLFPRRGCRSNLSVLLVW